jgi:hypothetical protein
MKLFRTTHIVILVMLLALFMAACGSTEEPTPEPTPVEVSEPETPTPTAEPTPEPTDTPEPTPTATPEPTPEPEVDLAADFVSYESPFSGITLAHPAGWIFEDFFFTIFASDAALLDSMMESDDLPDGLDENVFGFLIAMAADEFDGLSPEEVLEQAIDEFDLTDSDVEVVTGPVETTFNGQPGIYLIVTAEEDGRELALLYLVIFNEELNRTAVMVAITSPSAINQFLPQLLAIANTIEMVDPEMGSLFDFDFDLDDDDLIGDRLAEPGHRLVVTDTLAVEGEHFYEFTALEGAAITAVVTPLDDLDVVLEIYDEEDDLLLQVDDFFGEEMVTFIAADTGYYVLVVRGYAGQGGDYTIDLLADEDVTLFLVDGDEVISLLGEAARLEYAIILDAGETLTAVALPEPFLDIVVEIYDVDDDLLLDTDIGFSGESETLSFSAPADGVYFLVVRGFAGDIGQYTLFVEIE